MSESVEEIEARHAMLGRVTSVVVSGEHWYIPSSDPSDHKLIRSSRFYDTDTPDDDTFGPRYDSVDSSFSTIEYAEILEEDYYSVEDTPVRHEPKRKRISITKLKRSSTF